MVFFFNDTATTEIYTLSLHDALPIGLLGRVAQALVPRRRCEFIPAWFLSFRKRFLADTRRSQRSTTKKEPCHSADLHHYIVWFFFAISAPLRETAFPILPDDPRAFSLHRGLHLFERRHAGIARGGHGEGAVHRAVLHRLLRSLARQEPVRQAGREAVAAAHPVVDFPVRTP